MALINQPPYGALVDQTGYSTPGWRSFFSDVFTLLSAFSASGTTAQRPAKGLWVGRTYFDTDVGTPIWFDGANWIQADGTVV